MSSLSIFILPFIKRWKWTRLSFSFFTITFISIKILKNQTKTWKKISLSLGSDSISNPLILLRCWLVPLCLLANNKIKLKKKTNSTKFVILISIIKVFLLLTFSSLKILLFFVCFEATLIPTFILITRLGAKIERIQAGLYFMFYTLFGSLPLLASILFINKTKSSLKFLIKKKIKEQKLSPFVIKRWWIITILAFLIKIPIYGFHLWLPKAHVEAPIAGSMLLAAILLKLGGYGLIRLKSFFNNVKNLKGLIIIFCCWGALITSILCLRQTDLKALIAYSSVGHMSLTASGILIFSKWRIRGALITMIAHGLVSSALFVLAKIIYERTKTRKIFVTRGFKTITAILPLWWLIKCAANLGLPPLPKFIGEILIISRIIGWSIWLLPILGITTVFSAVYSLTIYQRKKKKKKNNLILRFKDIKPREHIILTFHTLPLLLIIFSPSSCFIWFKKFLKH